MGSENHLTLPIINFSRPELKPGTCLWNSVQSEVHQALEEYGCFEASFDKVPFELRKSLFNALQELFDLPLQTKLKNSSKIPFHGYVGQHPMVPLYESMGIENAPFLRESQNFTNVLWPQGNPAFW